MGSHKSYDKYRSKEMKTKEIKIGNISIGGGNKIAIQSMTNTPTTDVDMTCEQISRLITAGCDIARVAAPNAEAARAIKQIKDFCTIPLVADIHFDYKLAVTAIESGADKIRINPGNVPIKGLDEIIDCAKCHKIAIRLGVNSGSADKNLLEKHKDKNLALVESLLSYVDYFEKKGFYDIVLSIKSSNVRETVELNKLISSKRNYPLHIGLTEAGVPEVGIVKNSVAIAELLSQGIGDTIRVSLTADPVQEVFVAKEILRSLGQKVNGVEFVSCPKCGRCVINLEEIASVVYDHVKNINKNIKVAVMGCEVNGPGECADADIGLAGGKKIAFFKHGKIYKTVEQENAVEEFLKEIDGITK
ncbi:MAG: flavodoxin-dependent (E)-4-hydroxy-3-methylbut-2-enyl-diphosphate synthase [Clostridia bacterium]|nr:flavodoxin-dependent (E)-4-hydroxy-3-methylbut-2-enyl-diphosphate synthase [Clostridia bacterium]